MLLDWLTKKRKDLFQTDLHSLARVFTLYQINLLFNIVPDKVIIEENI